ncbi:transcriptional regulator [Bacilli bacterium]|nr:transcriptional regulator [Bacilli bacterium]
MQVDIIRQLLFHAGKMPSKNLAELVGLTQHALKDYLADISQMCQSLGARFDLKLEQKQVTLAFSTDINLDKIMLAYLDQSLGYQILRFVFEHKKFSTFQLTQEFNSSEATIFRKLRDLNQSLQPFNIGIRNGQLVGDELQIRYFYYQLFLLVDSGFSSNDLAVTKLVAELQPEFQQSFSKMALKRLSCWLFVTRHRLQVANSDNARLTEIQDRFEADKLYQMIQGVVRDYLNETVNFVGKHEGAMFYCFLISFDILGEENFVRYDLTRRKKISTAVLDTYSREMIVMHYGYQKLSISDEKRLTYQLSQVHARALYFQGQLATYESERLTFYYQQHVTPELAQLIAKLIATTQENLGIQPSHTDFLWLNYASILIAIDLSLHENVSVGIELSNLPTLGQSLYYFLLAELSSLTQVHFEKYRQHHYYDLILTTTKKPISVKANYYYLSEFLSPYDIAQIKTKIKAIKHEKNHRR